MSSKGAKTDMHAFIVKGRLSALVVCALAVLAIAPAAAGAQQFGVSAFSTSASSTQAGAHADFTTAFALNSDALGNPVGQLKSVRVTLPQGVIGNPQAIAKCSDQQFQEFNCPADSQVGVMNLSIVTCRGVSTSLSATAEAGALTVMVANGSELCGSGLENEITIGTGASAETVHVAYVNGDELTLEEPLGAAHASGETVMHVASASTAPVAIFNMQPSPGHVATLGASLFVGAVMIQADLNDEGGYKLSTTVSDISTLITIKGIAVTLWGVPSDPSHDALRCGQLGSSCGPSGAAPAAFMVNPTDCAAGPLPSTLTVESWQGASDTAGTNEAAMTGCEALSLEPSIAVTPETTQADTPTGYDVNLQVPQNSEPYGLATPALRNVSVTLPAGTALAPGVANGLVGCSEEQFASESCPDSSKVGTVEVATPVLPDHLSGGVYVADPIPGAMYRIFLVVSGDNVTVKLTGHVEPNPVTGQLTTVFENNPQVPFSDFNLQLFGGPGAALVNPQACGPATTTSAIASYAGQSASPSSTFTVDGNGQGGACPASQPFSPSLTAGTISPVAGAFSPFTLTISRGDEQQDIASIEAQLPPGLLAVLKSATPCPEPQAGEGACGGESLIGHTTVAVGAGSAPFYTSGQVFLTGPYKGGPYGLSIVVSAVAGPFNLGTVVVRAAVTVDRHTAQVTVSSDPLPSILDGVPLDLQTVNVVIDRPGFTFNPTSCSPLSVTGTAVSTQGVQAALSQPFQATNCASLPFHPTFTVSTQAVTSKANGASLDVKVGSGAGQANIAKAAVTLPVQLPARLTTIQQACTEAQFAQNPASCPAASDIGTATVATPLLASQLKGPVYLVSHGGAAFPDIEVILQGEGVTLELAGTINIKGKLTSSAFSTVPDAPITSFELSLPEGPHSGLAPNLPKSAQYSMCGQSLVMPTTLTGQNGAQVTQATKVAVQGCGKAKKAKKTKKKKRKHRKVTNG
jgi:hypothetical protein